MPQPNPNKSTATSFNIDLADVLSPDELALFEKNAKEAKASNLKEHFLEVFLRKPELQTH